MKKLISSLLLLVTLSAQAQHARGEGPYQESDPGILAMTIIFGAIAILHGFKKSRENGIIALAICSLLAGIFFAAPEIAMFIFSALWLIVIAIFIIVHISKFFKSRY